MTELPPQGSNETEQVAKAKLAELLEGLAPSTDYEEPVGARTGYVDYRQMEKYAREHERVVYPSDNPKESVTILAAAGRWNVTHRTGRKSDLYSVYHDGSVLPLQASDLTYALEIDMSRTPEEVDRHLLDLIEGSSSERPQKARRAFGKGILNNLAGKR